MNLSAFATGPGGRPLWHLAKRAGIFIIGSLLLFGAYVGILILSGNFHEVLAGKLYRSAQLSGERLGEEIDRYGIKTVVNLRGSHPGTPWYDDEAKAAQDHGARLINFAMSARKELSAEKAQDLVDLLRASDQPVLIHCMSGADRTGLASVIFLQQVAGVDEEEAEWQLSPIYGHLNLPFMAAFAMDDTWEAIEKTLGLDS